MASSINKKISPSASSGPQPRPPIVVVMGHVDHGKTTLLDYIRKTNVAGKEAGGITQTVGAYEILHNNRKITFIDTPGHEAFSRMRSRGAEVADLAILVVAADDGVKPQTKEAIETLNQAKTPFIVAVSKIDKTGGNIEKAKTDLASAGVFLEGLGGQVSFHGVSAKTGEGVDELLDLILLAADVDGLTFDPATPASGFVLETRRSPGRGTEVVAILKNGVLRRSDEIYTETAVGKVKILENFLEEAVDELEPSAPALIMGFEKLPQVGEVFSVGALPGGQAEMAVVRPVKPAPAVGKSDKPTLNLILKAADAGSLEALASVIKSLGSAEKPLNVINELVGDVTDGDVKSAIAMNSSIIGFRVKAQKGARNLAEAHEVKIIISEVIYDLIKTVEEFFKTLGQSVTLGELEVLAVFNQKKLQEQLIGGRVLNGIFRGKANFEVRRLAVESGGDRTEGGGKILSLREKKTDITQAESGREIGLVVNSQVLIKVGDHLIIKR